MQQAGKAPSAVSNQPNRSGNGGGGGGYKLTKMLLAGIVLAPAILILLFLSQYVLPKYVTGVVYTKDITNIVNDMGKLKTDAAQAINTMQTTVNGVPTAITSQVNTSVGQATTTMNGQIATIQTQVNNMAGAVKTSTDKLANVDTLSTKIDSLTAKQTTDEATMAALTTQVATQIAALTGNLTGQVSIHNQQIAALTAQVALLQSQQSLSNINISSYPTSVNFTSGNATLIGQVTFTNTAASAMTFTPKLVLTSNVTITSLTAIDAYAVITYGTNTATFTFPSVTLNVGSGWVYNPSIILVTAPTPNVWNVVWGAN